MTLKDVGCYNFRVIFGSRLSLAFNTMVLEDLKLIGLDEVVADMDEENNEEGDMLEEDDEENGDDNGMGDDELM